MLIFNFLFWGVVNYYSPIIFQPELSKDKIDIVESFFHSKELQSTIVERESRGLLNVVNCNDNGTIDCGKYQINSSNLITMGVDVNQWVIGKCPSMMFTMPEWMQDYYCRGFIQLQVDALQYKKYKVNHSNLFICWRGIGYVIQ